VPIVTRNGRPLFYREEGSGGPPILLVHGWCCDHTYMAPQIEHLASAHRVIAPDLSGHGRSDSSQQCRTLRPARGAGAGQRDARPLPPDHPRIAPD